MFCWWVGELLGVDVLLGIRLLGVVLLEVMLHGVELAGNVVLVECGHRAA